MCKTKSSIKSTTPSRRATSAPSSSATSSSFPTSHVTTSLSSLSSIHSSLPLPPTLFSFSSLSRSTNNFLSKPFFTLPSPCWLCTLHSTQTLLYRFPFRAGTDPTSLSSLLSHLTQSHHANIATLLGISLPSPTHQFIYLVYSFTQNSSPLSLLLRNAHNPSFTPLNSFLSRVRIACDLSTGLEYLHLHSSSSFHGFLSSSSVLVTDEPAPRAVIYLFGASDLAGISNSNGALMEELRNGYLAPELSNGTTSPSCQSDVFSLGVLLLELLSGEEPVRYRMDRQTNQLKRVSIIDKAKRAVRDDQPTDEEREGRVRKWVDRRLKDSFPVESVVKLIRVALRCVEEIPTDRAEITWAAGKVTKAFLEAEAWESRVRVPTDISISGGPR